MKLSQVFTNPAISGISGMGGETFISNVVGVVISGLFVIGVIIFMVRLIIGGFSWLTAGSDKAAVENAKSTISNSILGIIILLLVYGFINFFEQFIGFDITYFNISDLGLK